MRAPPVVCPRAVPGDSERRSGTVRPLFAQHCTTASSRSRLGVGAAHSTEAAPRGLISSMRGDIWIGIAFVGASVCAQAQWLNQPTPGAPRKADGKVNMTGPAPRLNGKADLS